MVQNGIKKHLQAIANAGARDKEAFYAHRNFIINNYLGGNGNQALYTSMASVIMYSQTIVKDYTSSRVIVTDV